MLAGEAGLKMERKGNKESTRKYPSLLLHLQDEREKGKNYDKTNTHNHNPQIDV